MTPNHPAPFSRGVLENYLRDDLAKLENPLRKDHGIIFQDLRFLFRAYGQTFKQRDWTPCGAKE